MPTAARRGPRWLLSVIAAVLAMAAGLLGWSLLHHSDPRRPLVAHLRGGNLTISTKGNAPSDIGFSLAHGKYSIHDAKAEFGAADSPITGGGTHTLTVPASVVRSITVHLGSGRNQFLFTGADAPIATITVDTPRAIPGDTLRVAAPLTIDGDATFRNFWDASVDAALRVNGRLTGIVAAPMTFAVSTTVAGTLTATATETAAPNFDNITVNAGVTVESTGGDVVFKAGDDVNLMATSTVKSDTGDVDLYAGFGDTDGEAQILLNGAVNAAKTTTVHLEAGTTGAGITEGSTGCITTDGLLALHSASNAIPVTLTSSCNDATGVAATLAAGSLAYTDVNTLVVGTVTSTPEGVTTPGTATGTGDMTLVAGNGLSLTQGVNAPNGTARLKGADVSQTASGSVTAGSVAAVATTGGVDLGQAANTVGVVAGSTAGGAFNFVDGSPVTVGTIASGNGLGSVAGIDAAGDVGVRDTGGSLMLTSPVDAGGNVVRLSDTVAGISQTSSAPITGGALAVAASNTVDLVEAANAVPVVAGTTSSGSFALESSGPSTVGTVSTSGVFPGHTGIDAPGAITLRVPDTTASNDDIDVGPVAVHSTGGDVTLAAGDHVVTQTSSVVEADGGKTVTLEPSANDTDGVGGASISGLVSGTAPSVLGGAGDDVISVFFGGGAQLPNGLKVDGGTGTNALNVSDQPDTAGHTYALTGTSLSRDGTSVFTLSNVAAAAVDGGNGADSFTVTPDPVVAFTVNGHDPTTPPGDALHFTGTPPSCTDSGGAGTCTQSGKQSVTFTGIETLDTPPDLSITKSGPATATPGSSITYQVSVTNPGPSAASSATMTDALPAGTTLVSATPPAAGWSCAASTTTNVSCSTTSAFGAGSANFTIVVHINPTATGQLSNTASVSSSGDPNTPNNTSTPAVVTTVGCDHTQGIAGGTVTLASGSTCVSGATMGGNIKVPAGATLVLINSTVGGGITATNAASITVCNTTVGGAVNISGSTGFVLLGDPGDDGCAGNTFRATMTLSSNQGGLELGHNQIGNTTVTGTTGTGPFRDDVGAEIEANTIGGNLKCSGNTPAATNDGQPNTVTGNRTGECASPGF